MTAAYPYKVLGSHQLQQGIEDNCFGIERVQTQSRLEPHTATHLTVSLDVIWFPTEEAILADEMDQVEDKLYEILRQVEAKDNRIYHAVQMYAEPVEDVLHFFVTYTIRYRKPDTAAIAQKLESVVERKD